MRGLLPQPRVDLVNIAPPMAIRGGFVGCSELERAALQVSQLVWYGVPMPVSPSGVSGISAFPFRTCRSLDEL